MDTAQAHQDSDEIGPWSTVEQLVRTLRAPAADAPSLVSQIVGAHPKARLRTLINAATANGEGQRSSP